MNNCTVNPIFGNSEMIAPKQSSVIVSEYKNVVSLVIMHHKPIHICFNYRYTVSVLFSIEIFICDVVSHKNYIKMKHYSNMSTYNNNN